MAALVAAAVWSGTVPAAPNPPALPPPSCPVCMHSVPGKTCDAIANEQLGLPSASVCHQLHEVYGCDCSGCECLSVPPSPPAIPPPPPTLPPPLPPPTPPVVLTLTVSGSISDYSDTSRLQQNIATAAGVDKSQVTISLAAASVIITATIAVPASTTAAAVQTSLFSTLGTAAAASAALDITVESDPAIATTRWACLNTCATAGDDICQDGAWGSYGSKCELGTDCTDCGERLQVDAPPSSPTSNVEPTSDSEGGLVTGLLVAAICLLVVVLVVVACIWYRKHRMQQPPASPSSTSTASQIEVLKI